MKSINNVQSKTASYSTNPNRQVVEIDATGHTVGKLAVKVANLVTGKNTAQYTPHSLSNGNIVIVVNAEKLVFSRDKMNSKRYYYHTGYPGGIKTYTPAEAIRKGKAFEIFKKAVKGMLPRNTLAKQALSSLLVYNDENHKHKNAKRIVVE